MNKMWELLQLPHQSLLSLSCQWWWRREGHSPAPGSSCFSPLLQPPAPHQALLAQPLLARMEQVDGQGQIQAWGRERGDSKSWCWVSIGAAAARPWLRSGPSVVPGAAETFRHLLAQCLRLTDGSCPQSSQAGGALETGFGRVCTHYTAWPCCWACGALWWQRMVKPRTMSAQSKAELRGQQGYGHSEESG